MLCRVRTSQCKTLAGASPRLPSFLLPAIGVVTTRAPGPLRDTGRLGEETRELLANRPIDTIATHGCASPASGYYYRHCHYSFEGVIIVEGITIVDGSSIVDGSTIVGGSTIVVGFTIVVDSSTVDGYTIVEGITLPLVLSLSFSYHYFHCYDWYNYYPCHNNNEYYALNIFAAHSSI